MDKRKVAGELVKISRLLLGGRFPSKAMDYNKVKNPDAFWKLSIEESKKRYALRFAPKEIGDIIMFLNMVAGNWKGE